MIVYVPIEDHGFAFLDTVTMRFVEVGGDQTFSGVTDLREAGGDQRLVEMAEAVAASRPTTDEARRLVDDFAAAVGDWTANGDAAGVGSTRDALLRALGVEA